METRFGGMTVNERLVVSGHHAAWEAAVLARDRARMTAILRSVDLGEQAAAIVERVLANPQLYGF